MKKILAIILATLTIVSLSGCGGNDDPLSKMSKKELIEEIENCYAKSTEDDDTIVELEERIDELETMLRGVQGEDVKTAAITEFSDGTGRLTLNSIDSIVQLPVPFEYPHSTQYQDYSSVNLTDVAKIKPSFNWIVKVDGTEIHLEHTESQISGVFKIGGFDPMFKVKVDELKDSINTFFESMPPETITYKRIYYNSIWAGQDAQASTFINEEPAQIRCGLVNAGNSNISYFIVYKGERDSSKDELILNLLKSITIGSNQLLIE